MSGEAPLESTPLALSVVNYLTLNARQRENYNFAKISGILADYGFTTLRLSDDWQGADFIANHVGGRDLRVQLKTRPWADTKYKGKGLFICFRDDKTGTWYLYPHDDFLRWALANKGIGRTDGWSNADDFEKVEGAYSWPRIPKEVAIWLARYKVPPAGERAAQTPSTSG